MVIGPSPEAETWTQAFDATAKTGVGQYTVSSTAVIGAHSYGTVSLTYDLYSVDPNDPSFDPGIDTVSSGNTITANASIDVTSVSTNTPEPALAPLLGLTCLACAHRSRRSHK